MKTQTYTVIWRYDIGDEVWYFDYSQIRKGIITEHGISCYGHGNDVVPQYTIKYGEGEYDRNICVAQTEILSDQRHKKHLKDLSKIMEHQAQVREVKNRLDKQIDDIKFRIKHNRP